MKRSVRDKRVDLEKKSKKLRTLAHDKDLNYDQQQRIRNDQDKIYKKWKFYNDMLKAEEKIKRENIL